MHVLIQTNRAVGIGWRAVQTTPGNSIPSKFSVVGGNVRLSKSQLRCALALKRAIGRIGVKDSGWRVFLQLAIRSEAEAELN